MKRLYWSPHTTKEQHLARLRARLDTLAVESGTWERLEPGTLNRYQLEALNEIIDKATLRGMALERKQP